MAFVFLGYVLVPIAGYLIYWVLKRLRRRGGEGEAPDPES